MLLDRASSGPRTAPPAPESAEAGQGWLAPALLVLVTALLLFALLRQGTDLVATDEPALVWAWAAVTGVVAAAFLPARYGDMAAVGRRALKGCAAFLAFYFLVEPLAIPYAALEPDHPAVTFHKMARWIGLALALAGFWRPAPVFAAAMVLWLARELQTVLTGFYFSTLDIRNVTESAVFWSIGFSLIALAARGRLGARLGLGEQARHQAGLMIFAAGLGAHLANYFWSALAKLWLDGGLFSWLLDNRLYDGIPAALEKGTLPLAAFPAAVVALDFALRWLAIPINIAAWLIQLSAIVAPWKRRWLIAAVVAFDLFHIAVWFSLGLLFWKWIALNLIILAAVAALRDEDWGRTMRITTLVFTTIGGVALFRIATLAWYESPGFASPYFVAEMKDGSRERVPNAFFLSSSYQVSQGRIWWPGGAGHFNHSIWGSVLPHEDLRAGRDCRVPEQATPAEPLYGPPEAVGRFVRAQHRQMLERADDKGRAGYYLVPHHHVPSPFVPDAFAATDLRQVARYAFVVDSVCVSVKDGALERRLLKRTYRPVYDAANDRVLP